MDLRPARLRLGEHMSLRQKRILPADGPPQLRLATMPSLPGPAEAPD
jgi:hypothetical protein